MKATNNISHGKIVSLDEKPAEVWKLKEFLLESYIRVNFQKPIVSWTHGFILPFPKKGDLSITKKLHRNYSNRNSRKDIYIYNTMLLNRIRPEIDPILKIIQMASEQINLQLNKF